uniref:RRM domain-containing protein n=1 Tax=Strigamia maritima TaxID=126957 RepID=T1IPZ9_STRMM
MRQVGNVTYAQRPNRDIGIVDFATKGDMENAIKQLDNTELYGCRIRLIEEKTGRSHNGSDSKSRPRTTNYSRPQQSTFRLRSSLNSRSRNYSRPQSDKFEDTCEDKLLESFEDDKLLESDGDDKEIESIGEASV